MNFDIIDIVIVAFYLLLIFGLGLKYTYSQTSSTEYFLGGRDFGWIMVAISLFATNISSEHIVGLAGNGYQNSIGVLNFELIGGLSCVLLSWTFGRYYIRNHIFTLPEYIEKRFNYFCRFYLSVGSIFAYILTKISIMLLAGAIFLEKIAGIDVYTSSICLVIITGIYTVSGGFSSVVYTSAAQGIILIIGGSLLTFLSVAKVGGFEALISQIPTNNLHLLENIDSSGFPWTGVLFGIPILTIWYHCSDQFMVQKFLVAKNLPNAQAGSVGSAYLKFLPFFLFIIPGIAAKILYPTIKADDAYATLILELLPTGLRGIVIAAFLAALMSSLSSAFASCSTLFTLDIYKKIYPNANDFMIVNVGRIMTFIIVILAIIWVIFIKSLTGSLYIFLQSVTAYIAPPITAIFITAILWSKANEKGASSGLIVGFLLGAMRFLVEILIDKKIITEGIFYQLGTVHFLHFAIFLFISTITIIVSVSAVTGIPSSEKVNGLTYKYSHLGNDVDLTVENQGSTLMRRLTLWGSIVFIIIVLSIYLFLQTR
ncbi:MAG: sodium transporter [Cytophagales bacterium]|nr:MAG: sodium transporter [Cytophagales bacterium]